MEGDESSNYIPGTQPFSPNAGIPDRATHRPEVSIEVFGVTVNALLDSGATISAISESFFTVIKQHALIPKCLSILPVTGVTISTALRGRNRKVTTQVFIPLSLFGRGGP